MTQSDIEKAEQLGRRRARMLPFLALMFIAQQASFFVEGSGGSAERAVDHVKFGAWLLLSGVLLAALWTGGFWLQKREVRALMDDEVTRAHRSAALSLGFLVAMLAAIGLYLVDLYEPMTSRVAIHLIVTAGIAAALLRFGVLERRVHRLG
jgi:hypothetical protein